MIKRVLEMQRRATDQRDHPGRRRERKEGGKEESNAMRKKREERDKKRSSVGIGMDFSYTPSNPPSAYGSVPGEI